jgi:hypothetical protein
VVPKPRNMTDQTSKVAARTPARAWRIGVLEDDAQLREGIILPGLRYFGFEVTGAGTASDALPQHASAAVRHGGAGHWPARRR